MTDDQREGGVWKSRLLTAVGVAVALAGCGGGGGGMSAGRDETPGGGSQPTFTISDVQTANVGATETAAANVARHLPNFGSVTQSSRGGGITRITSDRTYVQFDGSETRLTVRRGRSALRLDSASHRIAAEPVVADIPTHDMARGEILLDTSQTHLSGAVLYTSWNNADPFDYLAGGYWIHFEGTTDPLRVTGAEMGAFVGGPELKHPPRSLPVTGRATYRGVAEGFYASRYGSDTDAVGSTEIGAFNAVAALVADFRERTVRGCVGCAGEIAISGIRTDGATGEDRYFSTTIDAEIYLGSAPITADGTFRSRDVTATHWAARVVSTTGAWGGKLSSIADPDGDPRLAAGTFAADSRTAGGSRSIYVGAFHAPKQ